MPPKCFSTAEMPRSTTNRVKIEYDTSKKKGEKKVQVCRRTKKKNKRIIVLSSVAPGTSSFVCVPYLCPECTSQQHFSCLVFIHPYIKKWMQPTAHVPSNVPWDVLCEPRNGYNTTVTGLPPPPLHHPGPIFRYQMTNRQIQTDL